jgi:uncharacterized repeat protein (TIGR02543 family)
MNKINVIAGRVFTAGILLAALFVTACPQTTVMESGRKKETVTITLDANGGVFGDGSSSRSITKTIGTALTLKELPEAERDGKYSFAGWYTAPEGDTEYDFSKAAGTDLTLYAHWNWSFTVTFDANGGTFNGGDTTWETAVTSPGTTVASLPNASNGNNAFLGWFTDKDAWEEPFTSDTEVSGDLQVYARWNSGPIYLTVTFDANGGKFANEETTKTAQVTIPGDGKVPSENWPADPTLSGKEFDGWYTQAEGGALVVESAVITEDQTLYAQWADSVPSVTITFNAWSGQWANGDTTKEAAGKINRLDTLLPAENPALKGFTFSGWYTSSSDENENWGNQFTAQTTITDEEITSGKTVYAKWIWDDSLGINSIMYAVNAAGTALEGTLSNGSTYNETFTPTLVSGNGTIETVNGLKVASGNRYDFGPQAGAFFSKTDWTLEFYVNSTSTTNGGNPNPLLFSRIDNSKDYGGIWIENYNWYFIVRTGSSGSTRTQTPANPAANTWHHIAYVKSGNSITVYKNGEALALGSNPSFSMLTSNAYFKALFHNYFGAGYLKFHKFALYSRAWEAGDFTNAVSTLGTLNGTP